MDCFKRKKEKSKNKQIYNSSNSHHGDNNNKELKKSSGGGSLISRMISSSSSSSNNSSSSTSSDKDNRGNQKVINTVVQHHHGINCGRKQRELSGTYGASKSMDNLNTPRGESPLLVLSPGVDVSQQQKILEYRRRGGKKPNSTLNLAAGRTPQQQMGFIGVQQSTSMGKESHNECKKKELQLKQELEKHAKYIENQTVAMQRMEQTITYQYAIIQQLTQQIEAGAAGGMSSDSSESSSGSPDPLTELTKQFQQFGALEGGGGGGGGGAPGGGKMKSRYS